MEFLYVLCFQEIEKPQERYPAEKKTFVVAGELKSMPFKVAQSTKQIYIASKTENRLRLVLYVLIVVSLVF